MLGVLQVASYSSSCDIWSLGVILLELCLPQKAPRPHRWNFAFVLHAVGRAAFQMEFMILENILKVLGKPKEQEQLLDMTRYPPCLCGEAGVLLLVKIGGKCFRALPAKEPHVQLWGLGLRRPVVCCCVCCRRITSSFPFPPLLQQLQLYRMHARFFAPPWSALRALCFEIWGEMLYSYLLLQVGRRPAFGSFVVCGGVSLSVPQREENGFAGFHCRAGRTPLGRIRPRSAREVWGGTAGWHAPGSLSFAVSF